MRRCVFWIAAFFALPLLLPGQPVPAPPTPEDLLNAVRRNDLPMLRTGALRKTAMTTRDKHGATLLMYAAAYGSVDELRLLLDAGVPVNAHNDFNATALLWGAAEMAKVQLLLAEGADVNAPSKQGRTPLMVAAACATCSDIVKLLLEKGADAKARDSGGGSPLSDAASAGSATSVDLLLAAGADPNAADNFGVTPLMNASIGGNVKAVRALLAKGADPKLANTKSGQVKFGDVQVNHMTALMFGIPYAPPQMAAALIKAGADVNARDIRGMTPLMLAVATEDQNPARVTALLHGGANVAAKDATGSTALDWAARYGNRDVIAALTSAGARQAPERPAPARPETKPRPAREAVEAAAKLLASTSTEFFKQSGCVGCHHQPLTLAALSVAQAHGARVDTDAMRGFEHMVEDDWTRGQEPLLQRLDTPGSPDGAGYEFWAMNLAGYQPSRVADTVIVNIEGQQKENGSWHVGDISRAPVQESDMARTARAIRALQLYAPPALKARTQRELELAKTWMAAAVAVTNDDAAMQIVGLHWAGADAPAINALCNKLLALQRPDGGWSQNVNLESDALATGETLWALREAGALKPDSAAYGKAVQFLLATQWPDGSWYVRSRAPKIQPYFQSGFPFGHDQWISAAGTAWAVLGLAANLQ